MSTWGRIGLMMALALLLNTPFLNACTAPPRMLALLFEDVPPPGEEKPPRAVVREPRRPPFKPPPKPVAAEIPDEPPRQDWHGRYAQLPRNAEGQVYWIRALNEKLIAPKPGINPDAKDEDPTDMDVELIPKGQPEYKVVFPHKPHTLWLACTNCHTAIFEMARGKTAMTMAQIYGGALCGVCHISVAVPGISACADCHKAMPK